LLLSGGLREALASVYPDDFRVRYELLRRTKYVRKRKECSKLSYRIALIQIEEYIEWLTGGGGASFATFDKLKSFLGSPGWGKQWHHIVEQCQRAKSGFSNSWIQNSNNVINISKSVHQKISAHYSSKIPGLTGGKTVRDWLAGQSFQKQYEYGVKILRKFGVKI
jgi:hypothetical protein